MCSEAFRPRACAISHALTVVAQDGLVPAVVLHTDVRVVPVAVVVLGVEARRGALVLELGLVHRASVKLGDGAVAPAHLALRRGARSGARRRPRVVRVALQHGLVLAEAGRGGCRRNGDQQERALHLQTLRDWQAGGQARSRVRQVALSSRPFNPIQGE